MRKISVLFCAIFLISMLGATLASAHVTVLPNESTQGAYEKFAVRVPNEKDIPTVKVEVKFPLDAVSVSRFEPKPGWKYDLSKDANGKITGVIWTATGEGLGATEFAEFYMQGKVADNAASISWKAYQTYKDGSVVEWVGAQGSDKPASVTKVNPKPAGASADSHGNMTAAPGTAGAQTGHPETGGAPSSSVPLYLSIVSLALGVVSLIVAISAKNKRK
ncbi:YcnI family protein [Paenibacillus allorhizosphaerae]|uniref:YncI copper-binding domain-containing protein n=1 Tax=Paenibacillus allorhizosphaerae TaxID=2849866 RepID=A0ABM8VKY6_9BACL|nr:YcnI family protein [Paenibacillus allorhizosphaerae]CAG7647813.1 putative protein YcnI [Paenibacillus allorhizosphaerae]